MCKRFLIFCAVVTTICGAGRAHEEILEQIADLDTAITGNPGPILYLRRADLFRRHHDWTMALRDYDRAAVLAPGDSAVAIGRARVFLDSGEPRKALESLDPILAATPDHGNARLLEARAFVAVGETAKASSAFDRALARLSPPLPEQFLEHANALAMADPPRYPEAIAALDAGIIRLGDLISLHGHALELERHSGKNEDALVRIRRVLAASGTTLPWSLAEAETLVALHRISDAREVLSTVLTHLEKLPSRRRDTPGLKALSLRASELQKTLNAINTNGRKVPDSPAR